MLVAGTAQTSLMFSYLTCLPAVSLEPTTVHKGTLDPMQHRTLVWSLLSYGAVAFRF